MEAGAGGGGHGRRERERPVRKVQVVYYLCRNGQLEQPHFVEVPRRRNQLLRLKDVTERLTALRGKGMPSLFSWSCKRRYKNGYVWNDLAGDDVVHPAEGDDEYILKGSEIVVVGGAAEGFQRLQLGAQRPPFLAAPPAEEEEAAEEEEEEEEPEAEDIVPRQGGGDAHHSELAMDAADASPPSSSSSEKPHPPATAADEGRIAAGDGLEACRPPRSSILLQLIACGSAVAKVRSGLLKDSATAAAPPPSSGLSTPNTSGRRSLGSLHKGGGLRRRAAAAECDEEIHYMSENPRFGNPQLEDKEYFSGSIVESIAGDRTVAAATGPGLKKSSSYNEDRLTKCGLAAGILDDGEEEAAAAERRGQSRCVPGKKSFAFCAGGKQ
ncbi:unnamed protein product [Spirodela intermedia]|uniref:SOSEKI DIX-like domain-containing protein n=1 Tax=Spirodela intermedia TaxID=51605 RepID=A0A7I8KT46_SPIIN|nr:unnamed protein product [Spirodela intermedia]